MQTRVRCRCQVASKRLAGFSKAGFADGVILAMLAAA
jgi:hypothetical protein